MVSKISFLTNNILAGFGEGTGNLARLWWVLAAVTVLLTHSSQRGLGLVNDSCFKKHPLCG